MYKMCRHIMPTGHHCQCPAVKNALFCYHHGRQKRLTARPKRPYSVTIPFVFPEDRASIQINYQLAVLAVLEGKLEPRQANAIINAYRAAAANLKAGPLADPRLKNRIDRVILNPDGEEIAMPREALEPGETLTHGPTCPCGHCAASHGTAPTEEHHEDCNCGFCHEEEEAEEAPTTTEEPKEPLTIQASTDPTPTNPTDRTSADRPSANRFSAPPSST